MGQLPDIGGSYLTVNGDDGIDGAAILQWAGVKLPDNGRGNYLTMGGGLPVGGGGGGGKQLPGSWLSTYTLTVGGGFLGGFLVGGEQLPDCGGGRVASGRGAAT